MAKRWHKRRFVGTETIEGIREFDIPNKEGDAWEKMQQKVSKGIEYIDINPKELERRTRMR